MATKLGFDFVKLHLKNHLNSFFVGNRKSKVKKCELDYTKDYDVSWADIHNILLDLQEEKWLTLLKNLENTDENEVCVILKMYADGTEVPSNWFTDQV